MLRYIEQKTGHANNGPAWIARVKVSKSGRTVYFNGMALKRSRTPGISGSYYHLGTGDEYWITGVKKRGSNRHALGSGPVMIERGAVQEYLQTVGDTTLDPSRFKLVDDLPETEPSAFHETENRLL